MARAASQSTIHPLDTLKVRMQSAKPGSRAARPVLSKIGQLVPPAGAALGPLQRCHLPAHGQGLTSVCCAGQVHTNIACSSRPWTMCAGQSVYCHKLFTYIDMCPRASYDEWDCFMAWLPIDCIRSPTALAQVPKPRCSARCRSLHHYTRVLWVRPAAQASTLAHTSASMVQPATCCRATLPCAQAALRLLRVVWPQQEARL